MIDRDWHVLLVGGPSGTGKSVACASLMRRYGIGCAEIDDLSRAVKAMTTPAQQPVLHRWSTRPASEHWTPERIVDLTVSVAETLAPAVRAVVDAHLDHGPPVIMEGDYLLPGLAEELPEGVQAVFVHEPQEKRLVANFAEREPERGEQRRRARVSWMFGQWLVSEGRRCGVPVLTARPWNTLPDRIHAAAIPD